eukprot:CAMPEP_0181296370 /NCGR_PEP_ID=MMETSP1101-20121128/4666_1 /TAXON_ID=46948 /ORGANISM="Rhodomonas abbreviata, Strain Caron Lab Isolate" /LENGTH=237 /DNA_ID=CAMNT_0023401227 /DNA_START=21 /DNA_END=734 /DNA_ORIENTATION=+
MNGERTPAPSPCAPSEYQSGVGSAANSLNCHRTLFTTAANAVTRLYRSPDRTRFASAANSVTNLFREGEAEATRSRCKGSRESLKECLEWVSRQGMYVDSNQLAQLLKQQIAMYTERIGHDAEAWNEQPESHSGGVPYNGRPFAEEHDSVASHVTYCNRATDSQPSHHGFGDDNAVCTEAPPSSRKRRAEEYLFPYRMEDDEVFEQLPHIWPVKHARRNLEEDDGLHPRLGGFSSYQ